AQTTQTGRPERDRDNRIRHDPAGASPAAAGDGGSRDQHDPDAGDGATGARRGPHVRARVGFRAAGQQDGHAVAGERPETDDERLDQRFGGDPFEGDLYRQGDVRGGRQGGRERRAAGLHELPAVGLRAAAAGGRHDDADEQFRQPADERAEPGGGGRDDGQDLAARPGDELGRRG